MEYFALVKYKNSGKLEAVPTENIHSVVKFKGVKSFIPFRPTNTSDFHVSKKYRYVVHSEGDDGIARRWYVKIGRLGASPDEVLDMSKEAVVWEKRRRMSLNGIYTNNVSSAVTEEVLNDEALKTSPSKPSNYHNVQSEKAPNSDGSDVASKMYTLAVPGGAPSTAAQINGTNVTVEDLQKEIEEKLEIIKNLYALRNLEKELYQKEQEHHYRRINVFLDRLDGIYDNVVQRLSNLEKEVGVILSKIQEGANLSRVTEWVNSIPVKRHGMEGILEAMSDFVEEVLEEVNPTQIKKCSIHSPSEEHSAEPSQISDHPELKHFRDLSNVTDKQIYVANLEAAKQVNVLPEGVSEIMSAEDFEMT